MVSAVYGELISLQPTKHNLSELFRDLGLGFKAQLSGFNSLGRHIALTDSIAALMALTNASVDSIQSVSILAAASPSSSLANYHDFTDKMHELVTYESAVIVIPPFENQRSGEKIARSATTWVYH